MKKNKVIAASICMILVGLGVGVKFFRANSKIEQPSAKSNQIDEDVEEMANAQEAEPQWRRKLRELSFQPAPGPVAQPSQNVRPQIVEPYVEPARAREAPEPVETRADSDRAMPYPEMDNGDTVLQPERLREDNRLRYLMDELDDLTERQVLTEEDDVARQELEFLIEQQMIKTGKSVVEGKGWGIQVDLGDEESAP